MRDKNTCARTLAENVGGGLYAKGGVYAGHYGTLLIVSEAVNIQHIGKLTAHYFCEVF